MNHNSFPTGEQISDQPNDNNTEFPAFDKAEAERLRTEYKSEHSEQEVIKPEQLCVPDKMLEQIEQLGASSEILTNPAFKEILTDRMTDYGLLRCIPNQIEANKGKSLVGKDGISISYLGEKGDSSHHDRGNMNIIVERDGSLVLECACADRDKTRIKEDAFKGYREHSHEDWNAIETRNAASITEFSVAKQSGNLVVSERSSYETQLTPPSPSFGNGRKDFGLYSGSLSESTRHFDAEGVEQYREDISYAGKSSEGRDALSVHLGYRSDFSVERPERASFNLLRGRPFSFDDVERRTTLSRKSDGTVKVVDFYEGEKVEIENCEMNTEFGTDKLIPVQQAIDNAHEAAKQNKQQ